MSSYDPEQAAQAARATQRARLAEASVGPVAVRDPLPYCIYATVALIAWLVSPPLAVAFFAGLGLRKYWRAWRAGLRDSDCLLGDPRRVMLYLACLLLAGTGVTLWSLWQFMR
ncbi:MAG: hypothetical protein AB4911_03005 [Oscillochloridaceae bacterium umkhey_bin13]